MDSYSQLVERISQFSKTSSEEIERKVEAKRAKLSGLISKEGAAQIVAAELGINFDQEKLKLNQIVDGMRKANVFGKIIQVFPIREFSKNGREGKIGKFVLADESSNMRIVLWDTNHISLIEKGDLKEGDVVEISNGNVRNGEIHLSSFADIKKSKEKIGDVVESKSYSNLQLSDAKTGQSFKTRALIVQIFDPRYFEVSSKTGRKITEDELSSGVKSVKKALINVVLDDGSENVRAVIFGQEINKLGLSDDEIFSLEKFGEKKDSILGEEKLFSGVLRTNSLFNNSELVIDSVEDVNVDNLIRELEIKA